MLTNEQKINAIKSRITILEGRNKENFNIIKKLKRKLNTLEKD